jgi:hypothetical protein
MLAMQGSLLSQIPKSGQLWREWMSELQREQSQTDKARIYLTTKREITQTGPEKARFENGSYSFMLADGTVPDTDADLDRYTDVYEDSNPFANRDNPGLIPLDGDGNPLPTDADIFPLLILGNGDLMRISNETTLQNIGTVIDPKRGNNAVQIASAPASAMPRALYFQDYGGEFYYVDPDSGLTRQFPLPLYYLEKEFPTQGDVGKLESELVPGVYQVTYPTLFNPPLGRGSVSVAHNLVPNGSLTKGLKKPTWLVRSLTNDEQLGKPPVAKSWVNGRIQFDPYLPVTLTWDSLAGLASAQDFIDFYVLEEDEDGEDGRLLSDGFRVSAAQTGISFDMSSFMLFYYGKIQDFVGDNAPPPTLNANIYMRYFRIARGRSAADLSEVLLKVPVRLQVTYASWRQAWFAQNFLNEKIAGPKADPDKDGLTNQQEFKQGSNPTVPVILVTSPTVSGITPNSATLGATVEADPASVASLTIFERGIVYSAYSANTNPVIDGTGVNRVPSNPADLGAYSVAAGGLAAGTQYAYRGYVMTNLGTYYTSPVTTFTTLSTPPLTLPSVTSPATSGLSLTSVNLGGTVTGNGGSAITETGVVYSVTSTNDNPFIGGTGVTRRATASPSNGTFSVNITGLASATTYSFRAYAVNSIGASHTTAIGSFTTPSIPALTSPTNDLITNNSARLGGNVTNSGGLAILQRGVVFSSSNNNPLIGGAGVSTLTATSTGLGVFTINATNLLPSTLYHFKAYATNSVGTGYTAVGTFTTSGSIPTLANPTIANVTSGSVTLGANVSSDGQSPILERGFLYSPTSASSNPVEGGTGVIKVSVPGTTGVYSTNITGLTQNTGYSFRPFARNIVGIAYGPNIAFFTTLPPLTVITPTVSGITDTTAVLGGTVVSDSGTTVNERGVVYTTDPLAPPAIDGPGVTKVTATGSMGPFTVNATGLSPDTQYYYRAYATNNAGTSYTDVDGFRTKPMVLLGLAAVELLNATQQEESNSTLMQAEYLEQSPQPEIAFRSTSEGDEVQIPPSNSSVLSSALRFVYQKHATEITKPIVFTVETSEDAVTWKVADENWQVEHASDRITATWVSSQAPPEGLFFRVKGSLPD